MVAVLPWVLTLLLAGALLLLIARVRPERFTNAPAQFNQPIVAWRPYIVVDTGVTSWCVSSSAGRVLQPYVLVTGPVIAATRIITLPTPMGTPTTLPPEVGG